MGGLPGGNFQYTRVSSGLQMLEFSGAGLLDICVQTVAVRVHRDNSWKAVYAEMPHRFRNAEFHQVYAEDVLDSARIILGRAADSVQVNCSEFLQSRRRLRSHATLSDHCTHAIAADHVGLIRLLPNAGG